MLSGTVRRAHQPLEVCTSCGNKADHLPRARKGHKRWFFCPDCRVTIPRLQRRPSKRTILTAHQPNFMPFLGFYEKVLVGDVFVLMDDVQFTQKGWQNRADFVDRQGVRRKLTLPVDRTRGNPGRKLISEVDIAGTPSVDWVPLAKSLDAKLAGWGYKLKDDLRYMHVHVAEMVKGFERADVPRLVPANSLCLYNMGWIQALFRHLTSGTDEKSFLTRTTMASVIDVGDAVKTERLARYCLDQGCNTIWSGSGGATEYLNVGLLNEHGIEVLWQPPVSGLAHTPALYPQGGPVTGLSALDAIHSKHFDNATFVRQCQDMRARLKKEL